MKWIKSRSGMWLWIIPILFIVSMCDVWVEEMIEWLDLYLWLWSTLMSGLWPWLLLCGSSVIPGPEAGGEEACEECSECTAWAGEARRKSNNLTIARAQVRAAGLGGVLTPCWQLINHYISHAHCTLGDLFICNLSLQWSSIRMMGERYRTREMHIAIIGIAPLRILAQRRKILIFSLYLGYKSPQRPMGKLVIRRTPSRKNVMWFRLSEDLLEPKY